MNPNSLTKQYSYITPEERFRLIVAACSRGDEVERTRLVDSGSRTTISIQEHAPFGLAFSDLGMFMYIDIVEDAAQYLSSFMDRKEVELPDDEDPSEEEMSAWERDFRLTLAQGYLLRTKFNGWKLFCERLSVPPFVTWEHLPGYERMQISLRLTDHAAFVPEGFLRWLNEGRPEGTPEMTMLPLTAETIANELEDMFREGVRWWWP